MKTEILQNKNGLSFLLFLFCLAFFSLLSPSIINAATSAESTPFFFSSYAQKAGEILNNSTIILDSVSVNNMDALLTSDNATAVTKDDAIRIAGVATPGIRIVATYADKSLSATADYGGNWFVLFSITNMADGKYPVNVRLENSTEEITLVTLIVGEGNPLLQPPTGKNNAEDLSITDINKYRYIILPLIFLLSITAGWFLGRYYEKHDGFKVFKKIRHK